MMSTTYIAQVIQTVAFILTLVGINVGSDALTTTVTTIITIVSGLYVFYGRYKAGGITALGSRTSQ